MRHYYYTDNRTICYYLTIDNATIRMMKVLSSIIENNLFYTGFMLQINGVNNANNAVDH